MVTTLSRSSSGADLQLRARVELERRRRGLVAERPLPGRDGALPIWKPFEGKPQQAAYESLADELFYGGSAGGGKSDLLIGLAFTRHRRSVIFRREYPQLDGLIERSVEIMGGRDYYNANERRWRIPGGRMLDFRAMQHESDKGNHQGIPRDLIEFDELPHFTKSQYEFVIGWNRTSVPGQRCRVVSAGNPPIPGQSDWIIEYWGPWLSEHHPNPAKPGELRWFAMVDGTSIEVADGTPFPHSREDGTTEVITPLSRTFIPARVRDNPVYMASGYESRLQALPEPLRSQLLYGDFNAVQDDNPWQVIPTAWVRAAQQRWRDRPAPSVPLQAAGVDVARGGKDKTVIAKRHGNWFAELEKHPGTATPDGPTVAGLVLVSMGPDLERVDVNVDVIGVGASVYDHLVAHSKRVHAVNVGEGSGATDRSGQLTFANLRSELVWKMREALDPDTGDDLALPPDPELLADLCAPRWSLRPRGIQVESKDDIKARIGRSPDCGDAAMLTLAQRGGSLFFV